MSSTENSELNGASVAQPSEPTRQPFTKLTGAQASSGAGNRLASSNSDRDSAQQTHHAGSRLGNTTANQSGVAPNSRGFEIFNDTNTTSITSADARVDAALMENNHWKSIPTQTKTRKENQGKRDEPIIM